MIMFLSLMAAAAATTKILTAAKIAATVGSVCIAAQPVVDEIKRRHED